MVLFGLVLPQPERLMESWLREVDEALDDEEIVDGVMGCDAATLAPKRAAGASRYAGRRRAAGCWRSSTCATGVMTIWSAR